ncbi:MAG: ribokinase [Deferribacterales bacterium]
MSRFCVAGSINMDLVTRTPRFPKPGETLYGESFSTFTGGKGANQAVALAKLGADTAMIGKTGSDVYASEYLSYFSMLGVNISCIRRAETSTGIAVITVDGSGENSIIIVPGANGQVDEKYISSCADTIGRADYLLLQLEIPMEAVVQAAVTARRNNTLVMLDPAPAAQVPDILLQNTDIITPNETEAEALTGIHPDSPESFEAAGKILLEKGVRTAVLKAGKKGAYVCEQGRMTHVKGFSVETVDTTAAGDTFNAGLAYGLGMGLSVTDAARFANAAAAISTTKQGAQPGMPSIDEVKKLLHQ